MAKLKKEKFYTKKMLCAELQEEFGGSFLGHELKVDFIFDLLIEKIKTDHTVSIAKFGIFRRKTLKECVRHNPQNMVKVVKPAHGKVMFKPATALKEAVW